MESEEYEIIIEKQKLKIEDLEIQVNKLERRLLAYENAHTPPSLQKKKRMLRISSGVLGAHKGHQKYERKEPKVDSSITHTIDHCPFCQSKSINLEDTRRYIEEEIPEVKRIQVTEHLLNCFSCNDCGRQFSPRNEIPKERFGPNLRSHITLLRHDDRLPLRKVDSSLNRSYGLSITHTGIMKIIRQVANRLKEPYYNIIKIIRSSRILYIDETQYKLNGKTWWLWTFVCDHAVLFVIRKSRSKEVVEEILGKDFKGIIVCDGWKVYESFTPDLQRCWAHLLRESFHLKEKYSKFEKYHQVLSEIFDEIKEIRIKPPDWKERLEIVSKMKERIMDLVRQIKTEIHYKKFATTLENGLNYWFKCIIVPEVEPTNNFAEQALRELIVQRKIMGGLRSEKGAETLEILSTMITTWKKQELPLLKTMKEHIR